MCTQEPSDLAMRDYNSQPLYIAQYGTQQRNITQSKISKTIAFKLIVLVKNGKGISI